MEYKKKIKDVNIMIGCPEDAEKFISAINEGIENFNNKYGNDYGVKLTSKHYKEDTYSCLDNPQDGINKILCDECDLLIAFFYMSAGSANATLQTGTFAEIDYFKKNKKNAFVFEFKGNASIDMGNSRQLEQLSELIEMLKKNKKKILFGEYKDNKELADKVENQLLVYYKIEKSKASRQKNKRKHVRKDKNELQLHMEYHLRQFDNQNGLGEKLSFYSKAEKLIDGIREDGSVQYYIGKKERYRTTPTASVLEALYLGGLIPYFVCQKMQDWVYSSREDPCDEPDKSKNGKNGHEPDSDDQCGWSWNEGVSVWATSKALNTLIRTGYYQRQDVRNNPEICKVTCDALSWLADQAYENGGWGFQKAESLSDCAASVTMTALTLTTITQFLVATDERNGIILDDSLESKLSEAKQKGIQYLLDTKKKDADKIYWEYNGKPSLTGTVWVLDFINIVPKSEASDLYPLRKGIQKFCLESLPHTEEELECYQDEVYFTGGKTKYKDIPKNSKFYSYMPYHIIVLLKAGIDPDDEHIITCIRGLIMRKDNYWKGTDRSAGAHQRASCFVIAMALCVLAEWIGAEQQKLISEKI